MLSLLVDQGAMARGTPNSPNLQGWNLVIRLFIVISRTLVAGAGSYLSAEMQSEYSTADGASEALGVFFLNFFMAYQLLWINAKAILVEHEWYHLTHRLGDKKVQNFPKGISLKVNVVLLLEFRFAYYDVAVQHVRHYATRTPPLKKWIVFEVYIYIYIGFRRIIWT